MDEFRALLESRQTRRGLCILGAALVAMHLLLLVSLVVVGGAYPVIVGLAVIAYGFGLRHSVDPDHLAAIDNVTRKLMQDGKQPTAVGFFFALGHSTIVLLVSAVVAVSAGFITDRMPLFKSIGSLIGTSASCLFLFLIGTINLLALFDTIKLLRKGSGGEGSIQQGASIDVEIAGILNRILRPLIKMVNESWHIYWIGLIFGLGFDTASEVALLSLTGSTSTHLMPFYVVMLLPFAFACGMSLIDTVDGVFMLGAYGWAFLEPTRKIYYNICITAVSVILALVIGSFEAFQLVGQNSGNSNFVLELSKAMRFADWGYYIIGLFSFCWIASIVLYRRKATGVVPD